MRICGEHHLAFPRDAVWAALMDSDVLSGTLPGCESLQRAEGDVFIGRMQVHVGPVQGRFQGRLALSDLAPPASYRLKLEGRGPSGFLSGEGTVHLTETEGGTVLAYDLDTQVGGKLAGLGQRLLESSAKAVAQQGLEGLTRQLAALAGEGAGGAGAEGGEAGAEAGGGEAAGEEASGEAATAAAAEEAAAAAAPSPGARRAPAPPAPPPSQAEFAAAVVRNVLDDLVPREHRPCLVAAACFVAGLLLGFWMGRSRR
jgi:hypothetical protein